MAKRLINEAIIRESINQSSISQSSMSQINNQCTMPVNQAINQWCMIQSCNLEQVNRLTNHQCVNQSSMSEVIKTSTTSSIPQSNNNQWVPQ